MFLLDRSLLMSYYSNNDPSFVGYLKENTKNAADNAYAREWNKMLREQNNNNSYGSSMSTTTCNWGGFSNGSPVFSSSYYG